MISAGTLALVTVFVAELGDKTQLLALGFATRHRLRTVIGALAVGYGISNVLATIVGGILGEALPTRWVAVGGGVIFVLLAAYTLRTNSDAAAAAPHVSGSTIAVIATIASTIVLGELGDKTQITTATLAARGDAIVTWLGATLGVTTAGALAAVAGRSLTERLDQRRITKLSAAAFGIAGAITLVVGLR